MTENIISFHGALLDDTQVHTQNCCHSIIKSNKSKSMSSISKPTFHTLKPPTQTKSKSIQAKNVTQIKEKSKSFNSPTLTVKTASTFDHDRVLSMHQHLPESRCLESQVSLQKRSLIAKKCLQYKNRQIREHQLLPEKSSQRFLIVTPQKQHDNSSTQKETPRELQLLENSRHSLNEPFRTKDKDQQFPNQQTASKKLGINLKVTKSKKTLQRLYQQQSGRKIQVVESQQSEMDLYSVVEDHDWHNHF